MTISLLGILSSSGQEANNAFARAALVIKE
jgi:hypothetical protein